MEIGFYLNTQLRSEISGNIIDLCPVGALTSKPYAFVSRPWELITLYSFDYFDNFLSDIRVDIRGNVLLRVLPKHSLYGAEEFIGDVIRFSYDGLKNFRLTVPYICYIDSIYRYSWRKVQSLVKMWLLAVLRLLTLNKIKFLVFQVNVGPFCDLETAFHLKVLFNKLGSGLVSRRASFEIRDFSLLKANCLLLNCNLRLQAPVFNIKLRKKFLQGVNFYYIGAFSIFNYYVRHVSAVLRNVSLFLKGKS